jgi:uncharacterized protein YdeI (YjbR/CyaY-like superfamily)
MSDTETANDGAQILECTGPEEWRKWLAANYMSDTGVWIKFAKKASGITTVTYDEALDEALCYGWIDSVINRYDDKYSMRKFTPRRKRSIWSKINCANAERLITADKMQPNGEAEIDRAKTDGRWDAAYESQRNIAVPADFQKALEANPKAKEFFATLNKANRYAFLFRIHTAQRPETRVARIEKFVDMLQNSLILH